MENINMNKGKVISFNGIYGFINGLDDKKYYFDDRQFKKNQPIKNLKIGMNVMFDFFENEKGYKAKNIVIGNNELGLDRVVGLNILNEDFNKKEDFYITQYEYITKKNISAEGAKKEVEEFAKKNNCNFIIYNSIFEIQEENNIMYAYKATCGIYFSKFYFENKKDSENSFSEIDNECRDFQKKVKKYTPNTL